MIEATHDVTGNLRPRLENYLATATGTGCHVTGLTFFPGGLSWLTAAFDLLREDGSPAQHLIIKLGPPTGLMAPYSAEPQIRALQTFSGTAVPVPASLWHSDDHAVLGAPFLICSRVEGETINPFVRDYGVDDPSRLEPLGDQFADLLGAMHRLQWRGTPVAALAGPEPSADAGRAQVPAWQQRLHEWSARPYPALEAAAGWLLARCPPTEVATVVHGDYRPGNFLCCGSHITAILDWELVHIGDPHEDVAWALNREFRLHGLVSRERFLARYESAAGFGVSAETLRYYQVFTQYKLAILIAAAAHAFAAGSPDVRLALMAQGLPPALSGLVRAMQYHDG